MPAAQYACYEATKEKISQQLTSTLLATRQTHRLHLCADKGAATKDLARQAIVATYVANDGYPHEVLLSVASISKSSASGMAAHFTKHVSSFVDTQQVATISTDGAAVYTGKNAGMFKKLLEDEHYSNNILYIPDMCHRIERLLLNNQPEWFTKISEDTDKIIAKMNCSPQLRYAVIAIGDELGLKYYAMQAACQTRFAEYLHTKITSILRNVKLLSIALPRIIAMTDEFPATTRTNADTVLSTVTDPAIIAQLMLIDRVYKHIEKTEKDAQSGTFGAFDFLATSSKLKKSLEIDLRKADLESLQVLTSGWFHYVVSTSTRNNHVSHLNLLRTESTDAENMQRHATAASIAVSYEKWLDCLVADYDQYIESSRELQNGIDAFTLNKDNSLQYRVECLREFLASVNTEFLPCGSSCQDVQSCNCLSQEIKTFLEDVEEQFEVERTVPWREVTSDGLRYDYSAIIAHYLKDSSEGLRQKLNIMNVIRSLEVLQLMKASQSATERAFSILGNVVENRYEHKLHQYDDDKEDVVKSKDFVESAVFIAMNANVATLDAKLARSKFVAAGHEHALLSTKPVTYVGKAVKTYLENLSLPSIDSKRMEKKRKKKDRKDTEEENILRKKCCTFVGNEVFEEEISEPIESEPMKDVPIGDEPKKSERSKSSGTDRKYQQAREIQPKIDLQQQRLSPAQKLQPVIMLRQGQIITLGDKLSVINDDSWLEQNIVTGYLQCFQEENIQIFANNQWTLIEQGRNPFVNDDSMHKPNNWSKIDKVLVGKYEPSHFVLLYFDIRNRKCYYLNTSSIDNEVRKNKATTILSYWNRFIKDKSPGRNFELGFINQPIQQDKSSCGVLVCKMGEHIATDISVASVKTDTRSISLYRQSIWHTLYQNRDSERCCSCRQVKDTNNSSKTVDRWVQCATCQMWFHFSCAQLRYNLTEDSVAEMLYKCPHCKCL